MAVLPLSQVLLLFGLGFFLANLKVAADVLRFRARRSAALLTWQNPKPRYYGFSLGLGVVLGLLLAFRLFVQHRPVNQLFGETMMFVYYGYALPLSTRIAKGFYREGVLADTGFMRWNQISAVSWREDRAITLVMISRARSIARKLRVPVGLYGEARRLLRDRVRADDLHVGGGGLDLGVRDQSNTV
jgi:hypothetical protein